MTMRTSVTAISLALSFLSVAPVNLLADDRQGEATFPEHLRQLPNGLPFPNPTGCASTFSTTGRIDLTNAFFQDLGAIFRTNDGSNSPAADVSSLAARRSAYSRVRTKGLIRVGIGVPASADFELVAVDD